MRSSTALSTSASAGPRSPSSLASLGRPRGSGTTAPRRRVEHICRLTEQWGLSVPNLPAGATTRPQADRDCDRTARAASEPPKGDLKGVLRRRRGVIKQFRGGAEAARAYGATMLA
jgi:hypothetical protein